MIEAVIPKIMAVVHDPVEGLPVKRGEVDAEARGHRDAIDKEGGLEREECDEFCKLGNFL